MTLQTVDLIRLCPLALKVKIGQVIVNEKYSSICHDITIEYSNINKNMIIYIYIVCYMISFFIKC